MDRGKCICTRAPGMKYRARPKWRRRGGSRSHEPQSLCAPPERGGDFFLQRYRRNHPPEAPRNTTSYIIRSKSMVDAVAPVVTPSPFTPVILPTPGPLPRYKDQFTEEAAEWGVNGYGSMNGLIRMKDKHMEHGAMITRSDDEDDVEDDYVDQKNVQFAESLQQLEQRLDQGLNRFEMVYPCMMDAKQTPPLQVLLIDQEYHIAQLEEENLTLRERVSLIEREVGDLRSRIHVLEGGSDNHELGEVVSERSIGTHFLQ